MITISEFSKATVAINAIWAVEFDEFKTMVWHEILRNLRLDSLLSAIGELGKELKFPPKPADIVEKYDEIRRRLREESKRKEEAEQDRALKISSTTDQCYICRGLGILDVPYPPPMTHYMYMVRCSCWRGKHLHKWSKPQVTKNMPIKDPKTEQMVSIYIKDVADVLTDEEIGIIKARNMSNTKLQSISN